MPTYHFSCKSCSFEFDEFQKISDEPLKTCPSCKKDTVIRIIGGGAGVVFKGSGFYQTDYKKSGETSRQGSQETKETNSATKSETKPETKNESKPEAETKSSESSSSKPKEDTNK